MKILLGLLLLSSSLGATTLGQFISSPDGSSLQKFEITGSRVEYEKLSNFFDKKQDLSLGKFTTSYTLSEKDQAKIARTLSKIKDVDDFMKRKNASFNDLTKKNPHQSFIMLEQFRISQESDLYSEMKDIFDNLLSQEWKHQSGVRLTEDLKNIIRMKDGKEISREAFDFAFHCKKAEPPSVCAYKEFGILFVPKK